MEDLKWTMKLISGQFEKITLKKDHRAYRALIEQVLRRKYLKIEIVSDEEWYW